VTRILHRAGIVVITALVCVTVGMVPASAVTPTSAVTPASGTAPATGHAAGAYLALGDSVPFGYNPLFPAGPVSDFVGYPELAAQRLHLALTNLSCPGQASGGFLALGLPDNGCFAFREAVGLHANYRGSQLRAALGFLATHPNTRLVTITLGANDLFLCAKTTADGCLAPDEIEDTLSTFAANLGIALRAIRAVYHGRLVAVTYYTTNFADPAVTAPIQALDAVLTRVTRAFGGTVADGYTPFENASAPFGGNACAAGLLIALAGGACDIHPSTAGATLLADAVVAAAAPVNRRR
jgi:lysophospholipase L1-like esterase